MENSTLEELTTIIQNTWLPIMRGHDTIGETRIGERDASRIANRLIEANYVKQREGKWIPASTKPGVHAGMKCSECKARISYSEHFNGQHLFCHKCGAKMTRDTELKSTFNTYAGIPGYEAAGKE